MEINIVGGGPEELLPDLSEFQQEDNVWVGVDRGVYTLLSKGITPYMAFGDFDSVTAEELKKIEKHVRVLKKYKPEKDETDMELALNWALGEQPEKIRMFGATGGRLDHFFANVQLLLKPAIINIELNLELIDKKNHIYIKTPGSYEMKINKDRKYISFIPMSPFVKGLTLEGFKYPLKDYQIPWGSTLCISNELISDYGTFSFSEGILMVIRSQD
ncbi:thiamine diphosphokinase [Bacillus methanolicus]|uniref:thiamine diphosphokinase n=1 Tax=Bacillus methanolicus TaxID=1471 RepID=UPI002A41AA75|nr:thiamine diphosphokinase [Bacillus methanolicus]